MQTLMDVRKASDLTSRQLADAAGVPLRVEYLAEIGGVIEEIDARRLLEALSNLTGKRYTVKDVEINVRHQGRVQPDHLPPLREPGLISPTWKRLRLRTGSEITALPS